MSLVVLNKSFKEPPICKREILRYMGCNECDNATEEIVQSCIDEIKDKLVYKVCYCQLPLNIKGDVCDFEVLKLSSQKLAENLESCKNVILFAATVGIEIDRLIAKYGRISPTKALVFQAIGAERIEALCDAFCKEISNEYGKNLTPRFSPGYGDLAIETQREIFSVLECKRNIGLTLNDSLLMSPSKSVTAFVGLGGKEKTAQNKCSLCKMQSCIYRGVL